MGALHRRRFRRSLPTAVSRRHFLRLAAYTGLASIALPQLIACGDSSGAVAGGKVAAPVDSGMPPIAPAAVRFDHGVASGDPLADRVILWTRVSSDATAPINVLFEISLTPDFAVLVGSGTRVTDSSRDYTVKLDATGLASYTTYYYRFAVTLADGSVARSPIGRTKTAPKAGETGRLRIVSASCQNYTFGYFNAHAAAVAKAADLDLMLFLGDYIYETGGNSRIPGRNPLPAKEITTLADYRQRHAQYKTDPDLQALHRQIPFICVWDDHETTNNSFRASADNHTEGAEGCWEERMGWAIRAYFEWMPIRDNASTAFDAPTSAACPGVPLSGYLPEGNGAIYRQYAYGDLLDIIMLDTRLAARTIQNGTEIVSEQHTLLGDAQRQFLLQGLSQSKARWKFVAQQMTFAPIKVAPLPESMGGTFLNEDAWDGYRFDRNAVMKHIKDNAIENVVVLSGDTHVVTAFDLPIEPSDPTQYNPATGAGSLAVEFSNNGVANAGILGEFLMANNPHLKYADIANQGYLLLDVTAARVQGEYFFTSPAPDVRSATETFARALFVQAGAQRLTTGTTPSAARANAPALAP